MSQQPSKSRGKWGVGIALLVAAIAALVYWLALAPRDAPRGATESTGEAAATADGGTTGRNPVSARREEATPGGATPEARIAPELPMAGANITDEDDGREWPGIHTPLHDAKAKYWARVKPETAIVYRKPKKVDPEFTMQVYRGHLVEVLADEGPPVPVDSELVSTKPVRVGDVQGWMPENQLERVEDMGTPDPMSLWARLREAVASDLLPQECPVSVLVADFLPDRPGMEVLVYSISVHACRWAIGVFSGVEADSELLGYFSRVQLIFMGVAEMPGARAFVKIQSSWNEGLDYSGTTDFLLAVPPTPGEMVPVFEAITSLHDNRTLPPKVLISSFAAIDVGGDGQWLLQWRRTERTPRPEGQDIDVATEHFFGFNGVAFVEVPRPPGIPELPPPPPSQITVYED